MGTGPYGVLAVLCSQSATSSPQLVWVEQTDSDSAIIKLVQMSPAASHRSLSVSSDNLDKGLD